MGGSVVFDVLVEIRAQGLRVFPADLFVGRTQRASGAFQSDFGSADIRLLFGVEAFIEQGTVAGNALIDLPLLAVFTLSRFYGGISHRYLLYSICYGGCRSPGNTL